MLAHKCMYNKEGVGWTMHQSITLARYPSYFHITPSFFCHILLYPKVQYLPSLPLFALIRKICPSTSQSETCLSVGIVCWPPETLTGPSSPQPPAR